MKIVFETSALACHTHRALSKDDLSNALNSATESRNDVEETTKDFLHAYKNVHFFCPPLHRHRPVHSKRPKMNGGKHHPFFCCAERIPDPSTIDKDFMPFFFFLKYGRPVAPSNGPTSGDWYVFTKHQKVQAEPLRAHYLYRSGPGGPRGGYTEVSEEEAKAKEVGSHKTESLDEVEIDCSVHGYSKFSRRKISTL
jgi:hypothetical protein